MRKALPITLVFCLLMLSMAPFAMAQKQNIITNETTETLYVVYSTKFGAQGAIPDGYRTSGWKTIAAGQQRTFWAYDPHKVYFQIFKGSQPIKPERSTETFAFWINRNANFDIVTRQEINASITRDQLLYSSHGTNPLTHRDGFMQYDNGSRITVTDAWVAVDADDFDPLFPDAEPPSPAVDDGSSDLPVNIPDPVTSDATVGSVDPAQIEARSVGEQLMVNINITGGADVARYQVTVNFDPTALEYASSAHGDYLPAGAIVLPAQVPDSGDSVILSAIGGTAIGGTADGDGTLATITFNVVAAKASIITLTDVSITASDFNALEVTIADGRGIIPADDGFDDGGGVTHFPDPLGTRVYFNSTIIMDSILLALGKDKDSSIYRKEMLTLKTLTITSWQHEYSDLTGLEFALNLERLDLSDNSISDLSPLKDLVKLTWLDLSENYISDVSPLKDLVNLERLDLRGNLISDVSALKDLGNLTWLALSGNPVHNVDTLSHLTANIFYKVDDSVISDEPVNIPDPNLRRAIASELGKNENDPISQKEMLTLAILNSRDSQIADLTGLEFARNLRELSLKYNVISDLSPLKDLVKLRWLNLSYNVISDLSPLKDLVKLSQLNIDGNSISDLSPLKDLVKLEFLILSDNSISDLSPLKDLLNLKLLELDGNPINNVDKIPGTTITGVDHLLDLPVNIPDPNLRRAIASELGKDENAPISRKDMLTLISLISFESQIADLTGLEFALNLQTLSPGVNSISDVSPLKGLVNLTHLDLRENAITDVSPLKNLVSLKQLVLGGNSISDVSPLKDLVKLTWLSLGENAITDVSPLKDLVNLTSLSLYDNNISDVSPLKDLVNLRTLYLYKNNISDVSLNNLVNLERLDLYRNSISDVSLNNLVNLRDLSLAYNNISDVSPLKDLVNLRSLYLTDNSISDVSPLKDLVNLTHLVLWGNDISDISALKDMVNLTDLDLRYNSISDVSPLAGLVNLERLFLENNPVKNAYTLSHLTAKISGVDIRTCDTHMPDTVESLKPVQVYRAYERTKVSPGVSDKVGLSGSTSAAILSDRGDGGRDNRTWTVHDTMADESGSLTLTVKFLSPSEAKALEPIEPMKKDALVSPLDDLKSRIKELTNEWSETGNITWKFIEPGESGVSDIRIAFLDPSQQILYISWIGSPSEHEKEEYDRSVTMALSTDVPNGTILHEFGHALGLTHEHLSPQFRKWFTWDDAEPDGWANYSDLKWADIPSDDRIYKKIAFIKGYDETYGEGTAETIRKGDELADSIDNNYLEERKVDEMYSNFDNTSVMTYELDSSLLKTLPGAPEEYRALVDEEWRAENHPDDPIAPGIGRLHLEGAYTNTPDGQRQPGVFVGYERLSENDKKFIEQLYGTALQKVEVSGSVHIEGEEHDNFEKPSLINRTKTVASAVHADALEYVRAYDPIIFKWGGEQRVEVHLHHKRVTHRDIEIAVNALLYHGKGTDNTDLDDLDCKTFRLQTGHTEKVSFELTVDLWTSNADPACGGLDIDVHASGLKGGDFNPFFNPNLNNKATVTIKLTASPVSVGTPIEAPAAPSIAAIVRMADPSHDVNGDGEINAADLLLVSQYFGRIPPETPPVDVNNDDTVTIADLVQVAQHLQLSPVPAAPSVSMPAGLTYRTVEGWIDTARVESDGSRAFKIGIANLEALLRLVVPEETALLHNYPNPFNPETWIPYHLSEPAHVDLTIYTVDGKVVRHLDLGHQVAGFYQSKARAAHWDGRNNVGERVASGVYFYTLTAGEFTATRKLLILK